jgi:type IV pilus assembly protein PilQ
MEMRWLLLLCCFEVFAKDWTIHLQQVPIRYFLQTLADVHGENIVIGQNVQGKLDLHLEGVNWVQIWDFLQKTQHLSLQSSQGILWVEKSYSLLPIDKNKVSPPPLEHLWLVLKHTQAKKIGMLLQDKVNGLLSPFGRVLIDETSNSLWISDMKESIESVKNFIVRVDKPSQQIEIQARIVSMNKNEAKDLGVRLGLKTPENLDKPSQIDLPAIPIDANPISYAMMIAQFGQKYIDFELSALEGLGKAQIISSPRLITSNQEESSIASGEDIPYQETSLNGATSIAFKKALLKLKVKPQVFAQNRLMLDIEINQDADSGRRVQGVPIIDTKSIHTKVMVKSGETIVLGGIAKRDVHQHKVGLPILKDIPILGYLFSRKQYRNVDETLVLFITPTIF